MLVNDEIPHTEKLGKGKNVCSLHINNYLGGPIQSTHRDIKPLTLERKNKMFMDRLKI